jgi:putative phosphoesterase
LKVLLLSDVHSNIRAVENIWNAENNSDAIYCAGDLVAYGPNPREVIEWMMSHRVVCVRGNHDEAVISRYRQPEKAEEKPAFDKARISHNTNLLEEEHIVFLEGLPESTVFSVDGIEYGMTHVVDDAAVAAGNMEAYNAFVAQRFPSDTDGTITRVIFGHSHRQAMSSPGDGVTWLNPGSLIAVIADKLHGSYLGLQEGRAFYATITDGNIELKHLEYRW